MPSRAQNGAICELVTPVRANQISTNTSDFEMDVIIQINAVTVSEWFNYGQWWIIELLLIIYCHVKYSIVNSHCCKVTMKKLLKLKEIFSNFLQRIVYF